MEISAMIVVFVIEIIALVLSCIYCIKYRSRFPSARADLIQALEVHLRDGTLTQHLEEMAIGTRTVYNLRKSLKKYLWIFLALLVGIALTYIIVRYFTFGLWTRVIIGIVAISPAIYLLSALIVEEADENRIYDFEKSAGMNLLARIDDEGLEGPLAELIPGIVDDRKSVKV